MYDIVSLGELLIDFTEWGVSPGGMRLFEQNPGGAVANLAAAAARCGAKTAFVGKVGRDLHGDFLKRALEQAAVNTDGLVRDGHRFTTLAFVALGEQGERTFSFSRGADAYLTKEELPHPLLTHTRILHIGSLSCTQEPARSATRAAVLAAKAAGALISYDPNYRASLWSSEGEAMENMRALVRYADLIKLSEEETALLTGASNPVLASRILWQQGASIVCVTLGAAGALVRAGEQTRLLPGYAADAVDTTGAGDAFFGAFLARYLQQNIPLSQVSIDQAAACARFGNAAASLCVEKRGAIPAMPGPEAILARLRE